MKKLTTKAIPAAIAATLLMSAFSAAGAGAAGQVRKGFDPSRVGGKVILTSFADAVSLTPLTTSDSASNDIQGMIFESLTDLDINGQPIPGLAEKWTYDAATLTYTFFLRKGVTFHDGKPFTSADVKFTYDMYMHKDSVNSYKSSFESISSITVVNSHTIKFKLNKKDAFFLVQGANDGGILPKHQFPKGIEDYNNNNKIHRSPIGTGPFKFKQWKADERIVVVANKSYWAGRPYLDEVITRILPDSNVETINLLKGSVDVVEALNPNQVSQVAKDGDLKTMVYDQGGFHYVGFNNLNPIFADAKVRQALAYGLDRQSIVSKILLGKAYQASGPLHPKIPQNNPSVKPYEFDVERAKKLLDEAGWKVGSDGIREKNGKKFEIEVAYNAGNVIREKVSQLAQQNWKKLGVKVTPRKYEWSIYLDRLYKGQHDAYILGWVGYDGNVEHTGFFHSKEARDSEGKGGNNTSRVNDPYVDKILESYTVETNAQKRFKLYQDLHKHLADKQNVIYTYHPKLTAGLDENLANVKPSLSDFFWNLEDWYWKKGVGGR
ncbi:hypothetical protein SY83_16470 [Paenibacillus swuensis]|uniref:Solute-binding protein family 5 domain-containing protein n=1 Tax=Paenibacillus swuensis TaxID=1178515 RepID=A0A172TLG1_9BACL|nr:ABC transporter substrate-binding protein [Paenibacillus swuensis]ANE47613.1 hypothetical protein SY83_16470 [Paenibacillus swuensis]